MRILITGGAGCLGSNLIEHLLPKGNEILTIDNYATGSREVFPSINNLTIVEGDVSNSETVSNTFQSFKPEIVIHSAAAYQDPNNWLEDIKTNIIGSANIAKASYSNDVKKLINFQTALCYGLPKSLPIPSNHQTAPFTSYGITKTAGEQFMLLSGIPTLTLRIANVTGPRLAIGPIPVFYKRLKSKKSCFCSQTSRDFLDMSDFLSFMDLAIESHTPTGIFNVSTGESHSIKEIFDAVSQYLGLNKIEPAILPAEKDDVPEVSLDPIETIKAFGWKAKVGFNKTIHRQLAWYDKHGVSNIYSHLKAQ